MCVYICVCVYIHTYIHIYMCVSIYVYRYTHTHTHTHTHIHLSWTQPASPRTAAASKSCQSCPTLCDPIDSSPPGSCPWDSPGKNTGVGCHFLLQCMKVKSESEVAQSCPTLRNPMDCSLPGSSIHGISQARVLEWVPLPFPSPRTEDLFSPPVYL